MDLPGRRECCWMARAPETDYPRLEESGRADVAIIGAGIVGLTAAYALSRAGVATVTLEARRVGRQVTGRSTAKVTSQHTLIYDYLIRKFGLDVARLYADANESAVRQVCQWVDDARIACDLERKNAYAYTCRPLRRAKIEAEAEAARCLGLEAQALSSAPLPFATRAALRFGNQAQFNPAMYLIGLAAAVQANGGRIFERSRVTEIKRHKGWRVACGRHRIEADKVIVATHLPIAGPVHFDERTQPRCHCVIAYRAVADGAIDGMFIDIDQPTHSLRMGRDSDGPLLVVLGAKFKTGQDGDVAKRFRLLDRWVRSNVPAGDAEWRWVNEDYDSPDNLPYVGEPSPKAPGMYIATGFGGWGISNGTAAGITIADQVLGRANPWTELYDPTRRAPRHFNKGGDTKSLVRSVDQIRSGQGGVIKHGKQKFAVWKSADGKPHAVSASCTHMGCTVTWNNAEQTWDCPCHGSMFTREGQVIHGPATRPLAPKRVPSSKRIGGT